MLFSSPAIGTDWTASPGVVQRGKAIRAHAEQLEKSSLPLIKPVSQLLHRILSGMNSPRGPLSRFALLQPPHNDCSNPRRASRLYRADRALKLFWLNTHLRP